MPLGFIYLESVVKEVEMTHRLFGQPLIGKVVNRLTTRRLYNFPYVQYSLAPSYIPGDRPNRATVRTLHMENRLVLNAVVIAIGCSTLVVSLLACDHCPSCRQWPSKFAEVNKARKWGCLCTYICTATVSWRLCLHVFSQPQRHVLWISCNHVSG